MKNPICKNCTYYSAYYKQWSSVYAKLNHGYCSKIKKPQTQFEVCESFKSNEKKAKTREKTRLDDLDDALKSINDIALILKEKKQES